ncbi:response regulator transcription factor [Agaribacterium sp. ZY112]|uniref:response regulator transcription factor n=1 Tax=Agaribacterium sp. ZY112 TaxID=3233574 RepID=UPI003526566E
MSNKIRILLVEDNIDLAENISIFMQTCLHEIDHVSSALQAIDLIKTFRYDVLLLDVMLPGMDGFTLARTLRNKFNCSSPILFLTARDSMSDKVEGYSSGADDYLVKPFDLQELELKINAIVNRANGVLNEHLILEKLHLQPQSRRAFFDTQELTLTQMGFCILHTLVLAHPKIVSRAELEETIWQGNPPESDSIRSHIYILRQALKTVHNDSIIETIHGLGFRLNANNIS